MGTTNISKLTRANSQLIQPRSRCSKKNIIISAVALLAIGILITGILAIVSTLPNSLGSLNILKQIGLPGGIALTILGGLMLVALSVVVPYRHRCVTKKPISSTDSANKHLTATHNSSVVQAPSDCNKLDDTTVTPPTKLTLTPPRSSSKKDLEMHVTVYTPEQSHPMPWHFRYVDPIENLQTQNQFEKQLIETLEVIQGLKIKVQDKEGKDYASLLALLAVSLELGKYFIPPQAVGQISTLLQDPLLPLEFLFPLQQLFSSQNQHKAAGQIKIAQGVRFQSRNEMSRYFTPGVTNAKLLAITASQFIEGYDFGHHGLRIAVHQRPGLRTHALIRAHVNEFLSGKRNFTFKPKPNETDLIQGSIPTFCTLDLSCKIKQTLEDLNSKARNNKGFNALPNRRKAIEALMNDATLSVQQVQEAKDKISQAYDLYYEQNKEERRAVMLYILDALKEGRHHYYARRPEYFHPERLKAILKRYECQDHLPPGTTSSDKCIEEIITEGDERYVFEAAAQHLECMREAIQQADTYEIFESLADEFYEDYETVYSNLPTFSLSVAATIHPDILRETSNQEVCFHENGALPKVLIDLQEECYVDHSVIFQNFKRLGDHLKTNSQFGRLIDKLDRAVVQTEHYTELDPLRAQPKEKIDPLYQPQTIFDAVAELRSFLKKQEISASEEIQLEIRKQYPVLDSLEQQAACIVLEQVRAQNSLWQRGLEMVERVARKNDVIKSEESVEEFLQRLSDQSLKGYQNLRQELYNSEIAMQWLKQANQHVEGVFQKAVSQLNSGFVGILSQLFSFSTSVSSGAYLGGQALKQGRFYGILEVEPKGITPGKIIVLTAVPHNLADLKKAAGLIVEEGGPLSHAAHIARELAIPMVTGAKGAIARLKSLSGQPVCLTMDNSGNRIESHTLPFPAIHKQPSTTITKKATQDNAGGKGKHLVQLNSLFKLLPQIEGIQLTFPSFMILGLEKEIADFYATQWGGKTLKEAIEQVIDSIDSSVQVWDLIEKCPLPFSLEKYSEALKMDLSTPLIARSSAAVEDGASSFAGMFDSIPNLNVLEALEKGIKQVLFSAFSQKVKDYVQERNIRHYSSFEMAVILQQYVADAEISGVALSKDPVHSSDTVQIQLVRGIGGGVDAQGHPDIIAVDVQENTILQALPGEESLLLKPEQLRKIGSLIHLLEERFQFPVDVEFAIKKDNNDQLIFYLLQVRPITEYQ